MKKCVYKDIPMRKRREGKTVPAAYENACVYYAIHIAIFPPFIENQSYTGEESRRKKRLAYTHSAIHI